MFTIREADFAAHTIMLKNMDTEELKSRTGYASYHKRGIDIEQIIGTLEAASRNAGQCLYVIDLQEMCLAYAGKGSHEYFRDLSHDKIIKRDIGWYIQRIQKKDFNVVSRAFVKLNDIIKSLAPDELHKAVLSVDFHVAHGNNYHMLNHHFTPLLVDDSGKCTLLLCTVSKSSRKDVAAYLWIKGTEGFYFEFAQACDKWKKRIYKAPFLAKNEVNVLVKSAQGLTEREIADEMCLSVASIKKIKQSINSKLQTRNMTEALLFAINNFFI